MNIMSVIGQLVQENILMLSELIPSERELLRAITAYPVPFRKKLSVLRLSIKTSLSETTIRRNIKRLSQNGYIAVQRQGPGRPYDFEVLEKGTKCIHESIPSLPTMGRGSKSA